MYLYVSLFFFTLEDSLWEMLPEEWLRQTAKETGLKYVNEPIPKPSILSTRSNFQHENNIIDLGMKLVLG
jgi:hypothetical protein